RGGGSTRESAAHTPTHKTPRRGKKRRLPDQAAREGRGRLRRRGGGRPLRRHARRAVEGLHPPRRRPRRRHRSSVLGPRPPRERRGADAGRDGHGQGEAGHRQRDASPREGQGRPEAEGLGPRRRPRAREADRAEEAEQEAAKALRRAEEGGRVMDERPRYMISVAAELVGMHPQTLRMYEQKGLVQPQRTAGNTRLYSESDLERLRLIQQLTTRPGLHLPRA